VDLERGPLSLVRIIEELIERKITGSGSKKSRLTAVGSVVLSTRHPLSANLALTSLISGNHSVRIVRFRTKDTEFSFFWFSITFISSIYFLFI
jgi:hypothetical protein